MASFPMAIRDDAGFGGKFKYYNYDPSMGGAVIFALLFITSTILHFYQMFRTRTWFMIPFCIGGIFEAVGYVARGISHTQTPDWTLGPYIVQSTLLLVAPSLLAASIYMELGRIVLMVDGDHKLFIRRTFLTKIFVGGDVLSFLLQSGGAGLLATGAKHIKTGENIIMVGLVVQLIFFFLFFTAAALFHFRMNRGPTEKCYRLPWKKHMWSLYLVSILIFVRCFVRLIEYGQGYTGYIISHEAYLYIFDACLMWLSMAVMNVIHPSEVAALVRGYGKQIVKIVCTQELGGQYANVRMASASASNVRMAGPWA